MKAIKYLFFALLGIIALVAGLGLFAKKTYHIERSIIIDAPDSLVYEQLWLYSNFKEWSPWHNLDSNMLIRLSGKDGEEGFSFHWSGNEEVGEGTQTLISVFPKRLEFELDLVRPFKSKFPAYFIIEGDKTKTKVTWGFDPKFPFPINVWSMFTDIDIAMGSDYNRGLGYLKRRCEGMAHKKFNGYEIAESDLPATTFIGIRETVDTADIGTYYQENLPKIIGFIDSLELEVDGPPSGLYWTYDEEEGNSDMAAAMPVKEVKKVPKDFQIFKLDKGRALIIDYLGAYTGIGEAHRGMDLYISENKLQIIPPVIEAYLTDPVSEPDTTKWLTKVIYFIEPNPDSKKKK